MLLPAVAMLSSLVVTSIGGIVGVFALARRNGTLGETTQERFDREFDRIAQQLGDLR